MEPKMNTAHNQDHAQGYNFEGGSATGAIPLPSDVPPPPIPPSNILAPPPSNLPPTSNLPPPPDGRSPYSARRQNFSRYHAKKPVVTQRCDICNIELTGQVVIDAHMNGSKHAKKLKAKELLSNFIGAGQIKVDGTQPDKGGLFRCDPCNVTLNSTQQLDVHYAGAKHKAKVAESGCQPSQQDALVESGNEPSSDVKNESGEPTNEKSKMIANPLDLVCTICNITVNSPQQLEQHLNSKKHQDREAGRAHQRPAPYSRGSRGGRGGLGSQGRGGKAVPAKFTSLSNSFKSAGYSNSFIKPEGGVIPPQNCGPNKGPNQAPSHQNTNKSSNFGSQFKSRGNFGSLTPYVNTDNGRGGYNARGGGPSNQGGWASSSAGYGAHPGYSGYDYEQYGYGYGYENTDAYGGYGMMQPGPPPTF